MFELANNKNDWDWCYEGHPSRNNSEFNNTVQVRRLIEKLIKAWDANEVRPSHVYSIISMCDKALSQLDIDYKNNEPIPICYFSELQTIGALLVDVYLRSNNLQTYLVGIKDQDELDNTISIWEKETPKVIIFSFSALNYIDMVKTRGSALKALNTKIFAGGIVFKRSSEEKDHLPFFHFPSSLRLLLKHVESGSERWLPVSA
ncbi:hypothetical protein ABFB09_00090 [Dehalogenimonas sp. THU2]|uniref:hypothetical protein n=1 Tax=Dehalogenimonas sp. THU2 TaxID=3151121 RepID=UPI0032181AEB